MVLDDNFQYLHIETVVFFSQEINENEIVFKQELNRLQNARKNSMIFRSKNAVNASIF